ncbi:MAG: GNAT family N-acetyltransferase [Caulobacteraceae bacterium]
MAVEIRKALARDLACLPAVEASAAEAFSRTDLLDGLGSSFAPLEAWRPSLEAGTLWVAAEETGEIIGFLAATVNADALHIDELDVRLHRQGGGVGRRLIDAAIEEARALGLAEATLTTFRDVAWNGPFYARLGFREVPDGQQSARLAEILALEGRRGLDPARRCAMRRSLAGPA